MVLHRALGEVHASGDLAGPLDGLEAVGRLTDDDEVVVEREQRRDALAEEPLVVDEEDADRLHAETSARSSKPPGSRAREVRAPPISASPAHWPRLRPQCRSCRTRPAR